MQSKDGHSAGGFIDEIDYALILILVGVGVPLLLLICWLPFCANLLSTIRRVVASHLTAMAWVEANEPNVLAREYKHICSSDRSCRPISVGSLPWRDAMRIARPNGRGLQGIDPST